MTGTLRFLGGVEGKAGTWAGVELDDEFAGRGKNDGSVQG
jgi:CAP-Gly domain-containing linker protein 1